MGQGSDDRSYRRQQSIASLHSATVVLDSRLRVIEERMPVVDYLQSTQFQQKIDAEALVLYIAEEFDELSKPWWKRLFQRRKPRVLTAQRLAELRLGVQAHLHQRAAADSLEAWAAAMHGWATLASNRVRRVFPEIAIGSDEWMRLAGAVWNREETGARESG